MDMNEAILSELKQMNTNIKTLNANVILNTKGLKNMPNLAADVESIKVQLRRLNKKDMTSDVMINQPMESRGSGPVPGE